MNIIIFCAFLMVSVIEIFGLPNIIYSDCLNFRKRPSDKRHIPIPVEKVTINDFIVYNEENAPKMLDIPKKQNIPLARHHVIPWATIRDFFNLMLEDYTVYNNSCKILRNMMTDIMDMVIGPNNGNGEIPLPSDLQGNVIYQLLTTITPENRRKILKNQGAGNIEDYRDQIQTFFAWFPGNIFIGPQHRADDPKDSFEIDTKWNILSPNQYALLLEANNIMKLTIADRPKLSLDTFYVKANQVLNLFNQLLNFNSVTQFNPEHWDYAGKPEGKDHKWKINNRTIKKSPLIRGQFQILVKEQGALGKKCSYDDMKNTIIETFNQLVGPGDHCRPQVKA